MGNEYLLDFSPLLPGACEFHRLNIVPGESHMKLSQVIFILEEFGAVIVFDDSEFIRE